MNNLGPSSFFALPALALGLAALLAVSDGLAAVTVDEFPNADSVTVEEIERVTVATNGAYRAEIEYWSKMLTKNGCRSGRVIEFDYSARLSETELVYVGVIGTNGVERAIDLATTTKETTDNSSADENIYDPLDRHVTCTVPDLAIGETLHVKAVRSTSGGRIYGNWSGVAMLEGGCPILKSVYEVRVPKELPIRRKALRNPLGNVTATERTLEDGSVVHTYVATNSPQAFAEPDMPPKGQALQNVRLSTIPDWPTVSRWYWNVCEPHLAKTNAAMAAKVEELTSGKTSRHDAIRAVFEFVSRKVRYLGLTLEDKYPGDAPHDVNVTFENRYGVCRDKAGLLVAMLRLAGFEAYPVLIGTEEKMDDEVPKDLFNHVIVAVDEGTRTYALMDPTVENAKDLFPSHLQNRSYLVARPDGENLMTTPVQPPDENAVRIASKAWLDEDGFVTLENDIRFFGVVDALFREMLAKVKPENRIGRFNGFIRKFAAGAELVKCEIEPKRMSDSETPLRVKLVSRIPEALLAGETVDELDVPLISSFMDIPALVFGDGLALEKRRYPLVVGTTAKVEESLELEFDGHLGEVVSLPPDENLEGGFAYRRSFSVSNGVLRAARTCTLAKVEFSPEEYLALRERKKEIEFAERRRLRFAPNRLSGAADCCRLWQYDATTFSPYEWVSTSVVEHVALTSKGKGNIGEFKFDYHPSCETFEIVSATVSNRDGRVYSVSPKEINVMDSDWASRAPRYPAGKILVVSLPSVEIGSVVRLETVYAVTNSPSPYSFEKYFDDYDCVDRIRVRVDDWSREETNVCRLPTDANQIDGRLWRDFSAVIKGDWSEVASRLRPAADVKPCDPRRIGVGPDLEQIRNWLSGHVRVVGPSLYELPIERQLTDPETVLAERYATRLDYVRTLCSLLKGAGYKADIVFAAGNGNTSDEVRKLDRETFPRFKNFSLALCRVRLSEGGFLGIGARTRTIFIGTENEYTPIGATLLEDCEFFDPEDGSFGTVTLPEENLVSRFRERMACVVRETGETDVVRESWVWGCLAGNFRKSMAFSTSERRKRALQKLLNRFSADACATSDWEFDGECYPTSTRYSFRIPRYAEVSGDTITFRLPRAIDADAVPDTHERIRRVGIEAGALKRATQEFVVRFPEGYTVVEHLPEDMTLMSPLDANEVWDMLRTETCIGEDGCLEVRVIHEVLPRKAPAAIPAMCAKLFDEWRRRLAARGSNTIMVRKVK